MNQEPTPSYAAIAQARHNPNSWIYEVDGNFGPEEDVPPEVIVGAWRVDDTGSIVGRFIHNPNYSKAPNNTHDSNGTLQFPGWSQ